MSRGRSHTERRTSRTMQPSRVAFSEDVKHRGGEDGDDQEVTYTKKPYDSRTHDAVMAHRTKLEEIDLNIAQIKMDKETSFLQKVGDEISGSVIDLLATFHQIFNAFTIDDSDIDICGNTIQNASNEFSSAYPQAAF